VKYVFIVFLFIILGGISFYLYKTTKVNTPTITSDSNNIASSAGSIMQDLNIQQAVVSNSLDTPWAMAALSGEELLVSERSGNIKLVKKDDPGFNEILIKVTKVKEVGEGGLLGIAVDPDFGSGERFIYLYYTYASLNGGTLNRVVRMDYNNGKLLGEKILIDGIPGSANHNGGRIKFGPDKNLYITTGDAENPSQAQDTNSLSGKILRVNKEGKAVNDNPFGNLVYSLGHRNPQGITWDNEGKLWETEHGRSGIQSGLDEINLIEKGKNYGWPVIQGDQTKEGMETGVLNSGDKTWAPADVIYKDGFLYFGGLRGQALYKYNIQTKELKELFKNQFGRIREVLLWDNDIYFSTSNKDGRGVAKEGDDKIVKVTGF
jgi:glucose/arabinose dehydrogenase